MFVIIQNDPEVPPGTLSKLLAQTGEEAVVYQAYAAQRLPELCAVTGAIVLGGAMGVHDEGDFPFLREVRHFMAQALRLGVPLLGICLGGQLLADVLGGSVTPASPHGEKGISSVFLTAEGMRDPFFAGVPAAFTTFQWHGDSFLPPAGATLLASSTACPWEAFRYDRAVGIQFHPEVDRAIVSSWCAGSNASDDFLASFDLQRQEFELHSRTILVNFIREAAGICHP